jgi:excisionase family DNA binding protein
MAQSKPRSNVDLVPNGSLLLTLPELAAHLRINRATVYRLLQRGELPIPVLRVGRSPRVRSTDVERYLAELASRDEDPPVAVYSSLDRARATIAAP